jgi:hypothetical protein
MRQLEEQTVAKETSINQLMGMLLADDRNIVDYSHFQQEENKAKKVAQADNNPVGSVDRLEPSPIKPQGVLQVCRKIDTIPDFITQYCEDYIEVLSKLGKEDVQPRSSSTSSDDNMKSFSSEELKSIMDDRIQPYQNERWMERFQDLVQYFQLYGHFNVPYKQNPPLFQWVKRQRHQHKLRRLGHHSNLSLDRIEMLQKVGFVWDSHRAAWDEKFQELKEFKDIYDHCFVPCIHQGNAKLSTWIKRQRRQYRKYIAKQSLNEDRVKKLEDLDFAWDYYGVKETMVSDGEESPSYMASSSPC